MLAKLYIRNFALIEELEIQLGAGFNILTGETGAGKSLLLGAIGLILGRRVDYSMIFDPGKKCIVEASFAHLPVGIRSELSGHDAFDLEDGDLDDQGNHQITIRREAASSGKSRAFINDTPVSLAILREVTSLLVDLHGQHENQRLLSPDFQLRLLDQYAETAPAAKAFGQLLRQANQLRKEIAEMEQEERNAREQQDFFRFQLKELKDARLDPEEEEGLEQQLELLQNAEEVEQSLSQATQGLYDDEMSLYNRLSELLAPLENVAHLDPRIKEQVDRLNEFSYGLEDAARELTRVSDSIETDPATLHEVAERVDLLNRLKMKYSVRSIAELVEVRDEYAEKVGRFESLGQDIAGRQTQLEKIGKQLVQQGKELEKKRQAVTKKLKGEIDGLLKEVGLENAAFEVAVERTLDPKGSLTIGKETLRPTPSGINTVEFRIRTNKGMPMGSLNATASGGEVSRVMLAIKAALAAKAELSVLIFDEIDTGISGEVANKVGRVMQKLSTNYQLIAITHLPQIAGKGHHHFKLYKEVQGERTTSSIRPLEGDARVLELAEMLSGEPPSESAIRNARELISTQ